MASQDAKERVTKKFDLAKDVKEAKIKTSIYRVEQIDGKYKADFEISGLPVNKSQKSSSFDYDSTHKTIPKIFNSIDEFTAYTKEFFGKSDEEIIKLCKES